MFYASVIGFASGAECSRVLTAASLFIYCWENRMIRYLGSQGQMRMRTSKMGTQLKMWLMCCVMCVSWVRATQSICSSQNTATTDGVREQFQSNGWCSNKCSGHQFAIVQGYMCWCSDTEPSTQTSVSDCSGTCPGYGYEDCGSEDDSLFGYIYLGQTPLSSVQSVETSTMVSASSLASSDDSTTSSSSTSTVPTSSSTTTSSTSTSIISTPSSTFTTSTTSSSTTPTSATSSSTSTSSTTSSSTTSSSATSSSTTSSSTTSSSITSSSTTSSSTTSTTPTSTTTILSSITQSSTTESSVTTTASPTLSTITSVNLQTSLMYSVITVTSVQTKDSNVSEFTSRYFTTTRIVTQIYPSAPTETATSVTTTTSAGGRITNSNNGISTNKSTEKKGYWHSPGKIAGTFAVVGVVCLVIICALIYLIHHYRTKPARKAQDFENEYQRKFSLSKNANGVTTTTLHTPSPSSDSTFSTPRLIYTDEKGQVTSESPSLRQSTYSMTAGSLQHDPSVLASPFGDPTPSRRASTFVHSPTPRHHDKVASTITLGEDTVLVDQRLDPSKMLNTMANDDATTHSAVSLSDNVDYSRRVLRVMNE
ncbi:hypothetical protein SEUBUCD646_0H00320 [Saccharomyces eubayanus]|uniref:WSC domain-containing protein n=2 Tax=Saccharomyces TaxID=4930 RepID=A0ABN8VQT3_SACEU|nr:hypothetical protein SEUBUCD650_0H00330 [Saccharomyces eubayanus]CAI2033166.1 hypothetical protein SEUBUCD646_0H00320 [Saccharomyces eubayanus]